MAYSYQMISVRVAAIEQASLLIKRFTLQPLTGTVLPAFSGGSHIIVQMQDGDQLIHNAYSLMGSPFDVSCYQIAVRREEASRGGSAFMHDKLALGATLQISTPHNLFPLVPTTGRQLLIAGGIGITPFMAQMEELAAWAADFTLHYSFRSRELAAFVDELADCFAAHCHFYDSAQGEVCDVAALLQQLGPDDQVYVCGPPSLIDAVIAAGRQCGLRAGQLHWEQFAASTDGQATAFEVVLARSGRELQVAPGMSILQAIEQDGSVAVDCLCREGVCGTCEVGIVEGEAQHLDQYLSPEEKAAQKTLMICVSRARGGRIVLDL